MENNIIKIGPKHVTAYCLAANKMATDGIEKIILKARGSNIQRAVDVSQVTVNRFLPSFEVKNVSIGTDKFKMPETPNMKEFVKNISWIEITLGKRVSGLKDGLK